MSGVDLLDPCHTCDFVARLYRAITSQHATVQLHVATLLCQTNQASITDYDIHANSLVLVGCLAKRKRTMNRRVEKRLDTEPICHFGTVFVKEDHETGKVVQKPCFLRDKVAACNSTVAASATLSCDKVAHSCNKIARQKSQV